MQYNQPYHKKIPLPNILEPSNLEEYLTTHRSLFLQLKQQLLQNTPLQCFKISRANDRSLILCP